MGSDSGAKSSSAAWRRRRDTYIVAVVCFVAGLLVSSLSGSMTSTSSLLSSSGCTISLGNYKGPEYTTSNTLSTKCLVESPFLKLQQHQVSLPDGKVVNDWLFIDYHDRINVLVEAPMEDRFEGDPHYYIFEQTKYALEDRMSLAIVGGLVEPDELPIDAAAREVREEMHVDCGHFYPLGRFRTDVNRGAGWTTAFLARDCQPAADGKHHHSPGLDAQNEVGKPDTEKQKLRIMSLPQIEMALSKGKFLEIQWTATVALGLFKQAFFEEQMDGEALDDKEEDGGEA